MRLGEKRGFDFECEGRILAHSVFSLRTPLFTGAQANSASVYLRRGVSRHAKPLIIAAAPMAVVIDFRAVGWHLRCIFACGCGGAIEHQYRKSAPVQRQRKVEDCVLPKESAELLRHSKNMAVPDPSKGYTGDYPLCVLLVTFRTNEKSPQRSVRGGRS